MKRKFKNIYPAAIIIAGLVANAAHAQPLESELTLLLATHPNIKRAELGVESGRAGVDIARATYYPRINVTSSAGPTVIDSPSERATDPDGAPWSRTFQKVGTTITQNIFDAGRIRSDVMLAELNREIAEISLESARQNTMFEATRAYIDVLRQRRLVDMATENERTIQRQLNLEDERVRRGSGIAVDVLQAKSRLQIAKERQVGYEGALDNAITRYTQIFDHPPQIDTMIDPSPPAEVIPSQIDRAVEIALSENPSLISSSTTVEAARERREKTKSEFYPTIDVVGAANFEKHSQGTIGVRRDYSVIVQANWDIFTGFSSKASTEKGNFDYQASRESYDQVSRKVIEQVHLSWQSLITAGKRKYLLGNAVNIASEVATSRTKLRDAGKETIINVLDAENEVNNAQINYTSSSYDERIAVYQLLLAMGRLNPEYLMIR